METTPSSPHQPSLPPDWPVLELSADFQYVLDRLESGASLFVTGRAGTGKSTLLQLFRQTTRRRVVVLAPTGVAALNVKGQTIHSFFGFPPRLIDRRQEIKKKRLRQLYEKMDTLVIDEISMVRADLLDHIDYFLRLNREDHRPFGGVQVVFFGDLFQLPPVVASEAERRYFSTEYTSAYFFAAHVMREGFPLECIELSKVYRQDNRHFLRLLDAIRTNRIDEDDLAALNARWQPRFVAEDAFYITLSARNHTVDAINRRELDNIALPARAYMASVQGDFPSNLFPAEAALALKLSAQVMLLRNDPDKKYVNGTIGRVVKLEDDRITVLVEEKEGERQYIDVQRAEWEILRYKMDEKDPDKIVTERVGAFTQFPLRLAWAVTIHKAQGKTFDRIIIDLGSGAFEHGQTYVALSRCRTLEGIVLRQPLRQRDVLVDEAVAAFYETMFR